MTGPFSCIPQYGLNTLETPDKNVGLGLTQIMPKTLDCESDVCVWQYVKAISLATSLCDKLQLIKKWHPNKGKVCLCLWSLMEQDGSKPLSCHVQWQRGRYRITLLLMKQGRKCSSLMNNILAVIGNQSTAIHQDWAAIKEAPNTEITRIGPPL